MIAFEVFVNGKKGCTAGVGDNGELNSTLMLTLRRRNAQQTGEGDAKRFESLKFHVGASVELPDDISQQVEWLYQSVAVGDEITIRIMETEVVDTPIEEVSL